MKKKPHGQKVCVPRVDSEPHHREYEGDASPSADDRDTKNRAEGRRCEFSEGKRPYRKDDRVDCNTTMEADDEKLSS